MREVKMSFTKLAIMEYDLRPLTPEEQAAVSRVAKVIAERIDEELFARFSAMYTGKPVVVGTDGERRLYLPFDSGYLVIDPKA